MPDFTREEIEEVVKASQKFEKANLAGIDLSRAHLSQADLRYANLKGANLRGANLYLAKNLGLAWGVLYNKYTEFPQNFDPEAARMYLVK